MGRNKMHGSMLFVAVLSLTALSACAHGGSMKASTAEVWKVENKSPCVAKVALVSQGQAVQRFGDLPAGASQIYRVHMAANTYLSAVPVEANGSVCAGTDNTMRLVQVTKQTL